MLHCFGVGVFNELVQKPGLRTLERLRFIFNPLLNLGPHLVLQEARLLLLRIHSLYLRSECGLYLSLIFCGYQVESLQGIFLLPTIHLTMTDRHQQKPYPLRMPDELRTRLEDASKKGSRSLHAEIIARLEASFSESSASMSAASWPPEMLKELERLFDEKLGGVKAVIDTGNGLKETTLVAAKRVAKKSRTQ